MSCVAQIGNHLVWLVLIIAAIMIVRLLIAWVLGLPLWPARPAAQQPGQPPAAPGPGVLASVATLILGILDIVFWAVIVIAVIWLVVDIIGCLSGAVSLPRPFR